MRAFQWADIECKDMLDWFLTGAEQYVLLGSDDSLHGQTLLEVASNGPFAVPSLAY